MCVGVVFAAALSCTHCIYSHRLCCEAKVVVVVAAVAAVTVRVEAVSRAARAMFAPL